MIKVAFFSSSERALSVFETLVKKFEVVGVVITTQTTISSLAKKIGVPLLSTQKLEDKEIDWILSKGPDVIVSSYFGLFVPEKLINFNEFGVINVHPSLLPRWRGPSPVQAAIAAGEHETGVTFIKMDSKFDHGPVVAQFKEKVLPHDSQETLYVRLFKKSSEIITFVISGYMEKRLSLIEQDHKKATYCKIVKRQHGFIEAKIIKGAIEGKVFNENFKIPFLKDFEYPLSAAFLERYIRALSPWPGCWTHVQTKQKSKSCAKRLKILKAHLDPKTYQLIPNTVQLEGKNPVSWEEFKRGYPNFSFS